MKIFAKASIALVALFAVPLLASAQVVNTSASTQQSFLSELQSLQQELSALAATIDAMITAAGGTVSPVLHRFPQYLLVQHCRHYCQPRLALCQLMRAGTEIFHPSFCRQSCLQFPRRRSLHCLQVRRQALRIRYLPYRKVWLLNSILHASRRFLLITRNAAGSTIAAAEATGRHPYVQVTDRNYFEFTSLVC